MLDFVKVVVLLLFWNGYLDYVPFIVVKENHFVEPPTPIG